jgi:hypothetical protein
MHQDLELYLVKNKAVANKSICAMGLDELTNQHL